MRRKGESPFGGIFVIFGIIICVVAFPGGLIPGLGMIWLEWRMAQRW